jgi:hypothetical protein
MGLDSAQFLVTPSDELLCGICLDVFQECWVTSCKHRFCHECLQLLLTLQEPSCSFCRETIRYEDCTVDVQMNRRIRSLEKMCHTCNKIYLFGQEWNHVCKVSLSTTEKDIWVNILSYLDAKSLCKIQRTNKTLNRMGSFGRFWRTLYHSDLNQPENKEFNKFGEWKQYYKVKWFETKQMKNIEICKDLQVPDLMGLTTEDMQMRLALELSLKTKREENMSFDPWQPDEYVIEEEENEDLEEEEVFSQFRLFYHTNNQMYQ